ncbi:MAG: hypothetical protein AAFU64_19220 [Bacteroidota bacterium]
MLDQDFLKRKQLISQKIIQQLSELQWELKSWLGKSSFSFPEGLDLATGKISRGEKYQDLPYYILDFPRLIQKEDVFSIRTMCWWGNEYSCTLHLQGKSKALYQARLRENLDTLQNQDCFFCLGSTPWEYHFQKDNYQLLDDIPPEVVQAHLEGKEFFKISRRLDLSQYNQLTTFVENSLEIYLTFLDKRST